MRTFFAILMLACLNGTAAGADKAPPPWAFAVNPPGTQPAPDDGTLRRVPGSSVAFTLTQIRDLFTVPDWHPDDHPPMPEVVRHGTKPGVFACGYCHLPNGLGRPENSSLAGLPAEYIVQQVADFRSGARKSSEPASLPVNLMIAVAKAVGDVDLKAAAEYFSTLRPKPWIRVIETNTVPKTHVAGWMLVASEAGATEPIGQRIIEMPEDLERTELRDAASGFVAYVPAASIRKGETLVTSGGAGKTTPCAICHGADLRGLGPVPALAGRSPSYVVRQLYDIRHGVRNGPWAELMKAVVAQLSEEDMVAIAAYTASRAP
ncbi:MAG TPA: c-type cytochrome [Burkholderiales bacterium]|jgi:cytochrome c553|nr:c-type cytochrome [Burkholderiales bacterium]